MGRPPNIYLRVIIVGISVYVGVATYFWIDMLLNKGGLTYGSNLGPH